MKTCFTENIFLTYIQNQACIRVSLASNNVYLTNILSDSFRNKLTIEKSV